MRKAFPEKTSEIESHLVFSIYAEPGKANPNARFYEMDRKNVVKWRNNAKIKRVQRQPQSFQRENVGKKFQTLNFRQ